MRRLPLLLAFTVVVTFAVVAACAAGRGGWRATPGAPCAPFDHTHATYARLLEAHVDDAGVVDYTRMAKEGRALLDESVRALEGACAADEETWTSAERLAYWINAYNLYTLRLVAENMPVASIQDLGVVKHTVWFRTVTRATALHEELSLDAIEHTILRGEFTEPRIHFAIVCASQSCPKLARVPYVGASIDAQLDEAARTFVRDESKNRYDAATHTLALSSIFDWFEGDFTRGGKTLVEFVARHLDEGARAAVTARAPTVTFLDYDWSLNGR